MTVAWAVVVAMAVTAGLRIIPGLLWRFRGMDAGAHLMLRRQIRRNRMRLSIRGWPLLLDNRITYPWGFHWALALLPESWLRRFPPLPSAISDAAHAALVVWLAAGLAPRVAPGINPADAALLAGLLFATAPALLVVGFGPRAYEVTPRPFGELLYSVTIAAALVHLLDGGAASAIVAILAGGVLLLSSKFAAQVMLFCTPIMALVMGKPSLLLLLTLSLAAAMLLSGGAYRWVLHAQLVHLRFYRRRMQYEHPVLQSRNRGRDLVRAAWRLLRQAGDGEARRSFIRLAEGHTFLQFLLRNVLWCGVIALLALSVFPAWPGDMREWQAALVAWAAAPLVPFVVTSLRDFRFLGEAERYPEYGIAPVSMLAAIGLLGIGASLRGWILAAYLCTFVPAFLYTYSRLRWNSRKLDGDALDDLVAWLRQRPAGTVILPLPWHVAFQVMVDLDHQYLVGLDAARWCRDYDQLFDRYPWPATDLAMWRSDFSAELVVVDRPQLAAAGTPYPFNGMEPEFDNGRFQVFRLAPASAASAQ
jgi:hypothetical protein